MEDDLYMYNKILNPSHKEAEAMQPTPLALSQLSILTSSDNTDDNASIRLSSDYYCSNNDSTDRDNGSQSSITNNSQCASCISSTPTTTIDDVKLCNL